MEIVLNPNKNENTFSYQVNVNSTDNDKVVSLHGSDVSVFMEGKWCVAGNNHSFPSENGEGYHRLLLKEHHKIEGSDALGPYKGIQIKWNCRILLPERNNVHSAPANYVIDKEGDGIMMGKLVPIVTTLKAFDSKLAVVIEVEWPDGAINTNMSDSDESLTNFPSFYWEQENDDAQLLALSWQGSFIQSVHGLSKGPTGGPTVLYNSSDVSNKNVMILSPFGKSQYYKTFTAGNNKNWKGESALSPGTSGRITRLPKGFKQSFILMQAKDGGITAALAEYGKIMEAKSSRPSRSNKKLDDITLQKIGYQTDNGSFYCFCHEQNCSETLLTVVESLQESQIQLGYLSFQGAGSSIGRGQAAPWCVETWGVDGGLNHTMYPIDLGAFQKAIGIPLQLYAPYFCPNTSYFGNVTIGNWTAVNSDVSLPGCDGFEFKSVSADESKDFYGWFLDKGLNVGMKSFEPDFMNENFNCVPDFIKSATKSDKWLFGMAEAALERKIPLQWCYATPSDILASINMPAVTNFRVSFDFCYGRSWDIGESSLLVWALGAAPSKDTLWTSDNNKTAIPGCQWTEDHEAPAAELHLVLSLMSTGPVGISDAIGMTNINLLKRAIAADGTLLKPTKAITAVDSTFIKTTAGGRLEKKGDYIYGTAGIGMSWIFVSFKMEENYSVYLSDFWPPPNTFPALFVHRTFDEGEGCIHDNDAISSGCIQLISIPRNDQMQQVFEAPKTGKNSHTSPPGADFEPVVTSVWQSCPYSGWFFLGELSKYVPLSPARFRTITCLHAGVSATLIGSIGEVINVTALKPRNDYIYFSNFTKKIDLKVIHQMVTIPSSRMTTVTFGGSNLISV